MKKYYLILSALMFNSIAVAQETNNPWSFEAGVNYVNVYSVGEDTPQGDLFDEYFNVNDHWNLGTYFAVTRNFSERLSLTVKGSFNEITKWGETANDVSVFVDNLEYYGLDGMLNFKILKNTALQPYIAVGGGYSWIEEGPYNTFALNQGAKNLVGAGTLNGALGLTYAITDRFGVNVQLAYKHAFKAYLTTHWQNSVGITYRLGGSKTEGTNKEALIDTDGDGVPDAYDLCPSVFGLKAFAGCPDTDGDGVPDNLDKCPTVKGSDQGCPAKKTSVNTTQSNVAIPVKASEASIIKRSVYFEFNSATLTNNAKVILDIIAHKVQRAQQVTINSVGHTDNIGREAVNTALSQKRAHVIKDYLVSKGIKESNITTTFNGKSKPIATNATVEGRALNRRAELTITVITK